MKKVLSFLFLFLIAGHISGMDNDLSYQKERLHNHNTSEKEILSDGGSSDSNGDVFYSCEEYDSEDEEFNCVGPKIKEPNVGYITEIINNTGSSIRVKSASLNKTEVLVSKTRKKETYQNNLEDISPNSRLIVHSLKIDQIPIDNQEQNVQLKKGLHLYSDKATFSNSDSFLSAVANPFLILMQKGDFLLVFSPSTVIKDFNFLGKKYCLDREYETNFIVQAPILNNGTYTIEINELSPSIIVRQTIKAYTKDALEINFKKNNINSDLIKSQLNDKYPVASLLFLKKDLRPVSATIIFDKVVTKLFMNEFCNQIKSSELGKVIVIPSTNINRGKTLNLEIYSCIKKKQIQSIINRINKLRLPQYDE